MRAPRRSITFFNWFSAGLLTPVIGLMLLDRGCTLETLPLVLACYYAVVILFEVPSGVFADLTGGKRTFLISCALYGVAMVWLLFSQGVWALLPGFALYGLARAFATGSLDTLFVEECLREQGEASLATVTGQLSLWQTMGLAAGAVVGGALPNWRRYALHILLRLLLTGFTGFLAVQGGVPGFVAAYAGIYFVIGSGNVMEQTLLNRAVSDGQRAGFLSMTSLVLQIGGLAANGFSSMLVGRMGISGLFLLGGMVILATALGTAVLGWQRVKETAPL